MTPRACLGLCLLAFCSLFQEALARPFESKIRPSGGRPSLRGRSSSVELDERRQGSNTSAAEVAEPLHGVEFAIVAAHHKEDLHWLDVIAKQCRSCHVYVYTSSLARASRSFKHGTIREVPNVGREWGKYLRFIIDEWSALQRSRATVMFLHAHMLGKGGDDFHRGNLSYLLPHWPTKQVDHMLFLHGEQIAIQAGSNVLGPVDYAASIVKLWPTLFTALGAAPRVVVQEEDYSKEEELDLYAISGAEFSVPARQLVEKRPLEFYQRLERWLLTRSPGLISSPCSRRLFRPVSFNYAAGSILEMLAYSIFQDTASSSASQPPDGGDLFVQRQLRRRGILHDASS